MFSVCTAIPEVNEEEQQIDTVWGAKGMSVYCERSEKNCSGFYAAARIVGGQVMRHQMIGSLFCLAVLGLPAASHAAEQCSADCTHPTKACVCAIDGATPIAVTSIGAVERKRLVLRQALDIGDELTSASEDSLVGLTCPGGSDMKLHGRFRTVIMPAASGEDCALNLLAGSASVMTNQPTQLTSGETVMGSKQTVYSMRVMRDQEQPQFECVVFEGEADVQYRRGGKLVPLRTSAKATVRDGRLVEDVVTPQDITAASVLYSRADFARARAQGVTIENPDAFKSALQNGYAAVLARPTDPAPRIALAELQTNARISRQALYHLDKAEKLEPARTDQKVAIAATKAQAFKQIGREKEAAVESDKLRKLDPERYRKTLELESRKIDPSTRAALPARMVITATATPPVVTLGQSTTIAVSVATREGQPIAGAKVVLSVGGGLFVRTGNMRDEGITDASGAFRTQWQCKPCAPAYQITIDVTATNFPAGKATVDVKTR